MAKQTRLDATPANAGAHGHSPAPPGRMTYEQFLDWADEDTLAEGRMERSS